MQHLLADDQRKGRNRPRAAFNDGARRFEPIAAFVSLRLWLNRIEQLARYPATASTSTTASAVF
jgi:hypothetical protein